MTDTSLDATADTTEWGWLHGGIVRYEGDCQPITTSQRCRVSYPARTVYVLPLQHAAEGPYGIVLPVPTDKPVATTQSFADSGAYGLAVPAGTWSVYVEDDDGGLYGNDFSSLDNGVSEVIVEAGADVQRSIMINHATW